MTDDASRGADRYEEWIARLGRLGFPMSLLAYAGLAVLIGLPAGADLGEAPVGTPGRLVGAALVALAAPAFLCWCGVVWNLGPDPDHVRRLRLAREAAIWPLVGLAAMGTVPETAAAFVVPVVVVTLVTVWQGVGAGRSHRRRLREAGRAADVGESQAG